MLVYFDGTPGSETGVTIWFEPIWRYRSEAGYLVGSFDLNFNEETKGDTPERIEGLKRLDQLVARTARDLRVDEPIGDLSLVLDDGSSVTTFASDITQDELWHIRDNTTGRVLGRSQTGFEMREAAT